MRLRAPGLRTAAVATALAIGTSLLTAAPASADDDIRRALDKAGAPASVKDDADIDFDGAQVSVGDVLEIQIPGQNTKERELSAGTNAVSQDGYETVVTELDDGGLQILSVIHDSDAPDRYDYDFPGKTLEEQDDGSIIVWDGKPEKDADGGTSGAYVGTIDAPWATDANGEAVATRYQVKGDRLTQRVDIDSETAFPVVADPRWRPCWMWGPGGGPSVCQRYSKQETRQMHYRLHNWPVFKVTGWACGNVPTSIGTSVCKWLIERHRKRLNEVLHYAEKKSYRCLEIEMVLGVSHRIDMRTEKCVA